MHLLHGGVGVALLHPMVEDGFQVSGGNVAHDFVSDQREHLMLGRTFQAVVCGTLHRGELEHLQPVGQTFFDRLLAFIRAADLLVKLGDIVGDFLLGLSLGFAGEHFAAFDALLVKVPDDALPAAIGPPKYIAVCNESFLRHNWWFLPSGCFINRQQYRTAFAYVQTYVFRYVEKNHPAFWWIYTRLGRGNLHRPITCLATQFLRRPWLSRGGEKRGVGGSPPHKVHGGQPGALLALPKGRKLPQPLS